MPRQCSAGTQLDVNRYTPLAKEQAASQQDLDNAVQNNLAAKATVETARAQIQTYEAAVENAKINLGFTRLVAPIDGIAGQAQLQVGALATPSSGPVTSVSTVDPIKVYFTVGEPQYLAWRKRFPTESSRLEADKSLRLQLILADGSTYPHEGTFYFADRQVNVGTGAIRIAGLFPNAGNMLRPGGFARVRAVIRVQHDALLVPQRAVSELQGGYQVAVVDASNKVNIRPVTVGDRVGTQWIIRRAEAGRARRRRRRSEGAPGRASEPEADLSENAREGDPMSKFFINRPIVAIVISIVMVLVGSLTILSLPVAQFPNIAPPEIQVLATYVGADAQSLEQSVATPIEQQMSGVDNMNYMYSLNATGNSSTSLIVDFDVKTDPNTDFILDAIARDASRFAAPRRRQQLRRYCSKVRHGSPRAVCPLLAARDL